MASTHLTSLRRIFLLLTCLSKSSEGGSFPPMRSSILRSSQKPQLAPIHDHIDQPDTSNGMRRLQSTKNMKVNTISEVKSRRIQRGDVATVVAVAVVAAASYLQSPPQQEDDSAPVFDVASEILWHSISVNDCLKLLRTTDQGLSTHLATNLLAEYGSNELMSTPPPSIVSLILEQFEDRLVKILLAVAVFSAITASLEKSYSEITTFIEPCVILTILVTNAAVGVWQSRSASSALDALLNTQASTTMVQRDRKWISDYDVKKLVPGDVIKLRVGDKVPADCRLLTVLSSTLAVDEASLTGESVTVFKAAMSVEPQAALMDRSCMLYSGSVITVGNTYAVVTSTGMATEIGRISGAVQEAKTSKTKTPLSQSLDEFSLLLTRAVTLICATVWICNVPRFSAPIFGQGSLGWMKGALYHLKTAIALGVAAIPEGLPAVITLGLCLGTQKLAKKNVIVRKLDAVETLGCTSIICTDKTGTLTTNEMSAVTLSLFEPDSPTHWALGEVSVLGTGYRPQGSVELGSTSSLLLDEVAEVCTLCNEAALYTSETGEYLCSGEPTEAALLVLAEKLGTNSQDMAYRASNDVNVRDNVKNAWHKLATLEFNRNRKTMSVVCRRGRKSKLMVKGAPDFLLKRCSKVKLPNGSVVALSEPMRQQILDKVASLGERPLRVIGLAVKTALPWTLRGWDGLASDMPADLKNPSRFGHVEKDLTFLGLVGIKDLARPEASAAMDKCAAAGVRVMMITGDAKQTALAIARDVHILSQTEYIEELAKTKAGNWKTGRTFTGADFFDELTPQEQIAKLQENCNLVFCRTEPLDKQKLVRMLQGLSEVVAMTGDGVNDAAALQQAGIGIAMGQSGSDVAKEAADMVLTDDNFASIVSAVEEGRSIFANMQAFICFLVSCNVGELAIILTASVLGIPEPLTTIQLLWVNLVTDGPPATALGFNPAAPDAMRKPPRRKDAQLISKQLFLRYLVTGCYVCASTLGVMVWWFHKHGVSLNQMMSHSYCTEGSSMILIGGDLAHLGVSMASPCSIFQSPAVTAKVQTLALSVLVATEMLKALSSVSITASLLQVTPFQNWPLVAAVSVTTFLTCPLTSSYALAFVLSALFGVTSLLPEEWHMVAVCALPILLVEEILKLLTRYAPAS